MPLQAGSIFRPLGPPLSSWPRPYKIFDIQVNFYNHLFFGEGRGVSGLLLPAGRKPRACFGSPVSSPPPQDQADMREGGIVRRLTRGQKKTVAERMFCHRSLCGDVPCCGCRIRIRLQHEKRDTYYCESFHIYLYSRSPQPLLGHRNNHLLSTTNNFERRILLHIPATRRRRLLWQP